MLRLFLALNFLLLNLYACKGGYDSCKQKILDSNSIVNGTISLPVKQNKRLVFSTKTPKNKIFKFDPYLSLYLVEDKTSFRYPFSMNNKLTLGIASVDNKRATEGNIARHQIGLNRLGTFSEPISAPSVLLTSCCSFKGLVTPRGIIEKEYIERFLSKQKVSYSDIGIRVSDEKKCVLVNKINPFMAHNPFLLNDCIVAFDGKKVKDAASLMRWILFSKVGSMHNVKVKRGSKYLDLRMMSNMRNGGGDLREIALDFLGIHFDKNLFIVMIEPKAEKYGLKIGDKLLEINKKNIPSKDKIEQLLKQNDKPVNLLFLREYFQFFVKVKSI